MFFCIYFRTIRPADLTEVDMKKEIRYIFYCKDMEGKGVHLSQGRFSYCESFLSWKTPFYHM